jgi:chromosome partitioning protein
VWEELWRKFVDADPITKIISSAIGFMVLYLAAWLASTFWRSLKPWITGWWACCLKLNRARRAVAENGEGLWLETKSKPHPPTVVEGLKNLNSLILTVANLKGGVGKTTLTANLAAYFANPFDEGRAHHRVLVIDLDFQGSCSSMLLADTDWRPAEGLLSHASELISGSIGANHRGQLGQPVTDVRGARGISAFYDLARIENREMVRWLIGDERADIRYRLTHLLLSDLVRRSFDVILIDAPPRLTTASVQALCASTHVLIPSMADALGGEDPVGFFGLQLRTHEELWPHLKVMGSVGTITDKKARATEEPALNSAGDRLKAALDGSNKSLPHMLRRGETLQFPYECSMRRSAPLARAASQGIAYVKLGDNIRGRAVRTMFDSIGREVERRWRL